MEPEVAGGVVVASAILGGRAFVVPLRVVVHTPEPRCTVAVSGVVSMLAVVIRPKAVLVVIVKR